MLCGIPVMARGGVGSAAIVLLGLVGACLEHVRANQGSDLAGYFSGREYSSRGE